MALVNAKHPFYKTIIFDLEGTFLSTQSLTLMVKNANLVKHKEKKTLLVSNEEDGIYGITTKPTDSNESMWVFPLHVQFIGEQVRPKITFNNNETLILNCTRVEFIENRDFLYSKFPSSTHNREIVSKD